VTTGGSREPDEIAPGVFVFTAPLYTTTTTVVTGAGGGCLVIDPAVTAADLAALAGWLAARGLRPVAGWSTHPHWDHLLWSAALGRPPRYATPAAVSAAAGHRAGLIEEAERDAPGHDLTQIGQVEPWAAAELDWPGPRAVVYQHDAHAPGHGALHLPGAGLLVAGDMCSDIEIPLPDLDGADPFRAYRAGLGLLAGIPGVRLLVPGHGHVGDGPEFRRRLDADRAYLDAVEAGAVAPADPRLSDRAPAAGWLRAEHARAVAFAAKPATGRPAPGPGG
jgi:hydroxyacylglutathione hydrolase